MIKRTLSPNEALCLLLEGNERFSNGLRSIQPFLSSMKLKEFAELGQSPIAVVLTCSDSRIPTETTFDCGVGDIFVIRLAGNVVTPAVLASIEFAALTFQTSLCLVMGHTDCGAVKAAIKTHLEGMPSPSAHLNSLVKKITPSVRNAEKKLRAEHSKGNLLELTTYENIKQSVNTILTRSKVMRDLCDQGKFEVLGGLYNIGDGRVRIDNHFDQSDSNELLELEKASS